MAKTRKSYKLSRYKTRRNKRNLRKRRKTKKLRGGSALNAPPAIAFNNLKGRLNLIRRELNNTSSLGKEKLETFKKDLLDFDKRPITYNGEELEKDDTRYVKQKKRIKDYTQIVEAKINELSSSAQQPVVDDFYPRENPLPPPPPAVASTEPNDCKGKPKVSSSEILALINEARLKIQQAKKCGLAAPAAGGRRKKTRKRRR